MQELPDHNIQREGESKGARTEPGIPEKTRGENQGISGEILSDKSGDNKRTEKNKISRKKEEEGVSLNYKVKMVASLELDENWIDDSAIEGLSLEEIKKLCMELLEGDRYAFFEEAKWSISVEYKPTEVKEKEEPK